MEVTKPEARMDAEIFKHSPEIEMRVRSLRRPFIESEPSDPIVYRFSGIDLLTSLQN